MWAGLLDLLAKLAKDRRLAVAVGITVVIWIVFQILGQPNPLNTQRTFALFVIVAVICVAADWLWSLMFRRAHRAASAGRRYRIHRKRRPG